jgi:hypothetical protein
VKLSPTSAGKRQHADPSQVRQVQQGVRLTPAEVKNLTPLSSAKGFNGAIAFFDSAFYSDLLELMKLPRYRQYVVPHLGFKMLGYSANLREKIEVLLP